jgi:hypothetical protein
MNNWKEIKHHEIRTFQFQDEPEIIHIIKSGIEGKYIIIYEDAYELTNGLIEFKTKEEIKTKFNIDL